MDSWLGNRKRIVVLNREDMISKGDQDAWASYYARQGTKVVFSNAQFGMGALKLIRLAKELAVGVNMKRKSNELLPRPEIKRREDAITSAGVPMDDRNWPPFRYSNTSRIVLCLAFNVIAITICWIRGGGVKIFFLAIFCALMGCPLSYVLWYRPLYRAMSLHYLLVLASISISSNPSRYLKQEHMTYSIIEIRCC